jgi:hypothetical protein
MVSFEIARKFRIPVNTGEPAPFHLVNARYIISPSGKTKNTETRIRGGMTKIHVDLGVL